MQHDIGDVGNLPGGGRERRHILSWYAFIAALELQVGDDGGQVGVAAAFAKAHKCTLHLSGTGVDREH